MGKILLIAGCSHTAGSEIDGTEDSTFNRHHTFGNLLAAKLDCTPVNVATCGATNAGIARSVLEWFASHDNSNEVTVLIGWTEPSRMEVPWPRRCHYETMNQGADWYAPTTSDYLRINSGWPGGNDLERELVPQYQRFMADNSAYLEIQSANYVLQLQYFLRSRNVKYMMCNTMHMFTPSIHMDFYTSLIDQSCYYNMTDNTQCFYWKYSNLGYKNTKAKYWHHGEEPHALYAEELYSFMQG